MTQITKTTFTITDPREFDGDAFQVAERAIQQAQALSALAEKALDAAEIMARNAELERALLLDKEASLMPVAAGWSESPQGRMIGQSREALVLAQNKLKVVAKAASYNPKARLKAAA